MYSVSSLTWKLFGHKVMDRITEEVYGDVTLIKHIKRCIFGQNMEKKWLQNRTIEIEVTQNERRRAH